MWLPPFSHLGVRRDSPDPDTAEAERAGFCPPTQSSSKTEKRTKVVQQIYAKLRLKQPVLSPEMILASGRAGQQGCSTRSWNGAAAPQRRGREWESPGCRDRGKLFQEQREGRSLCHGGAVGDTGWLWGGNASTSLCESPPAAAQGLQGGVANSHVSLCFHKRF